MIRNTLFAISAAAVLLMGLPAASEAKTKVHIGINLGGGYYGGYYGKRCYKRTVKHVKWRHGKKKVWYTKRRVCR